MLRTTSGLSRSVGKWVAQVAASVGATLAATVIYAALPHPVTPMPLPEMTSGGKFAARAVVPVAYDGLDAMPLPHVAPAPVSAAPVEPPVVARRAAWDGSALQAPAPDRSAARPAKPVHAALRPEPRRVVVARAEPPASAEGAAAAAEPRAEDGIVPKIVPTILSTAHSAWTLTASAGDSLMARVVPQIP